MKAADLALIVASLAAVALVVLARKDSRAIASDANTLAQAQQNAARYGGSVQNWLGYGYIDNDPVQGIEIPGAAF
jgi:hypothetical protein